MGYVIAILFPPLAILLKGKIIQATLNLILLLAGLALTLVFGLGLILWIVAIVHACVVVHRSHADRRHRELVNAMRAGGAQA